MIFVDLEAGFAQEGLLVRLWNIFDVGRRVKRADRAAIRVGALVLACATTGKGWVAREYFRRIFIDGREVGAWRRAAQVIDTLTRNVAGGRESAVAGVQR